MPSCRYDADRSGPRQARRGSEGTEDEVEPIRAKQEQDREAAIAKAKEELAAYEKELAPSSSNWKSSKAEKTAKLEAELKEYEATLGQAARMGEEAAAVAPWVVLDPTKLKATNGAKLSRNPDLSVLAEAKDGPAVYTITAETDLDRYHRRPAWKC